MKKTTIQNSIERMAHVKTFNANNSTLHASKQALYNRIFKANNFQKYVPSGNESKFDLLVNYNIHVAITRHLLKNLASRGNINALELLNNINHTVSVEDLEQEILLKFIELSNDWAIGFDGSVEFLNDETMKQVFACVSSYLYKFQTKHFKHMYIELDGQIIDVTKVSQLADYVSIDNIMLNENFLTFYKLQSDNDKQWIEYRIDGLSNSKIALAMNVTYEKIRATEKRVRRNWSKYNDDSMKTK